MVWQFRDSEVKAVPHSKASAACMFVTGGAQATCDNPRYSALIDVVQVQTV